MRLSLAPDGSLTVLAHCEYPNGLALSPDERTMHVANTRSSQYIRGINHQSAIGNRRSNNPPSRLCGQWAGAQAH